MAAGVSSANEQAKAYYVVQKLCLWENALADVNGEAVEVVGEDGSLGYLLVFEDYEKAKAWAGEDCEVVRMQEVRP